MTYADVVRTLRDALRQPLPGARAHAAAAPRPRRDWPAGFNPARVRDAAGLLLVFAVDDRPHIVLTRRADHLERHGGQVSLPGGVVEPGETFAHAALREAHEEIGLELAGVDTLGPLTPIDITVSGFRLHPIVAATASRPVFVASDFEVAAILEVPLDALFDAGCLQDRTMVRDERTLTAPTFCVGAVEIWGATAMILAEFLAVLGWTPSGSELS